MGDTGDWSSYSRGTQWTASPETGTIAYTAAAPSAPLKVVETYKTDGRVLDSDNEDPNIQGIRRFMDLLAAEPRVDATAIQTVGSKGYDGFAVALVVEESA